MTPALALAVAICDAFFVASELPTRWATATPEQRRTFDACAAAALAAGRTGRQAINLDDHVAAAIAAAFWPDGPPFSRLGWPAGSPQTREVFRVMARAAIAAGRRLREQRQAMAGAAA